MSSPVAPAAPHSLSTDSAIGRDPLAVVLKRTAADVDQALEMLLPRPGAPSSVQEAMRYAIFAGAKRLRPSWSETAALVRRAAGRWRGTAAAIEALHTYSLVHDDLPAMDDDDLREACRPPTANSTKPPPFSPATRY